MAKRNPESDRERGFAMVALLIGMSVAAIWMTAALPAWRQQAQRQREEDLIFIGEQYARAIVLFQDKNRGALPPSIDVLVSGHYLRKKWKDPVTNDDFVPLGNGAALPGGQSLPGTNPPAGQTPGRNNTPATSQTPSRGSVPGAAPGGAPNQSQGQAPQGITGVRSKSTATSIKIYQNQQQYSLWAFDAALIRGRMGRQFQQPGGNQPGRPGGQNDRGGQQGPGVGPGRGGPGGGAPGRGPGGPGGAGSPPGPPPVNRGAGS